MRVLFIGSESGTSQHRCQAFRRLGHEVRLIDPRALLPHTSIIDRIEWKLHPLPLAAWVRLRLLRAIDSEQFDLVFVDNGSLVAPGLVLDLQARGCRVVNFNHDDPFGTRDGARFATYRAAVAHYDLIVVVRQENVQEAQSLGARRILHTYRVADEVEHCPREIVRNIHQEWKSEVAFVGTWMPERGPFLAKLLHLGVPLSIFGSGWEKAPQWNEMRHAHRTQHLDGVDYCYAVQCAKISLGLLSAGNRDLHTTRSMEIPALGSLLCAQRTVEHEQLYADGSEAVFWDSAEECAAVCNRLLRDDGRRESIARRGRERCLANGHFSERLLNRVIDACFS